MSGEVTDEQAGRFLAARRAAGRVKWVSPRSVMLPLGYLRTLGVAPAPAPVLSQGPLEELLEDYRRYLFVERGLSAHTVLDAYGPAARLFLAKQDGPDGLGLEGLRAADVTSFLARECPKRSVPGARDLVCALRSLLRYLHLAGLIGTPLVWAVPSVADLRDRTLPRGLEPAAVAQAVGELRSAHGWSAGVTSRSCCCCRGSGCAPGRSPGCASMTSTGVGASCSFAARAAVTICCRYPSMSAKRSCPTFVVALAASAGSCSCGSPRHARD